MIKQKAEKISDNIYRIDEFGLVNAFLVVGEEKAALIDTGTGLGNIREAAEEITQKPLSVLLTHKHPDHAGGCYHFRDLPIFMSRKDRDLMLWGYGLDNAFRKMYIRTRGPHLYKGNLEDLYALLPEPEPPSQFPFSDIGDGISIDLGGLSLEAIGTPSHTKGSVSYLLKEERVLFSGDTVNNSIILMRTENNTDELIAEFNSTLKKIMEREKDFDMLMIGHGDPTAPKDLIADYYELSAKILDGRIKGKYEESGFRKGDVARFKSAELWYRCDS